MPMVKRDVRLIVRDDPAQVTGSFDFVTGYDSIMAARQKICFPDFDGR